MPVPATVIIVSYNTKELLVRCLRSIAEQADQIIVVDNASADGSADCVAQEFPAVELIRSPQNLGFGAANNRGLARAQNDLVLFLNSDCEAKAGAIAQLVAAFDDSSVVAAGGRLEHADGSRQLSAAHQLTLGQVFFEQTFLERIFKTYWLRSELTQRVPQVMGACLMIRKTTGCTFDERFFLYCEDTELCLRLSKLGAIMYVNEAVFEHALGASSAGNRWWSVAMYNRGKELVFELTRGPGFALACLFLNRFGAVLRMVLKPRQAGLFFKVLTCPRQGPPLPQDAVNLPQ